MSWTDMLVKTVAKATIASSSDPRRAYAPCPVCATATHRVTHYADCPACTEPFDAATNPAGFAPCFHPLCQRCIDKATTDTSTTKRECLWFVEGAYCKTPYTANQLMSGKKLAAPSICGSCEEAPATHHCNDCHLHLCAAEAATHQKAKANRAHTVNALNTTSDGQVMCASHAANVASLFCDKCNLPACADCVVAPHQGHPFICITAGFAKRIQNIDMVINQILEPKRKQCATTGASVFEQISRLRRYKTATLNEIVKAFSALISPLQATILSLQARQKKLCEQATTAIEADIKALMAQYDELVVTADHIKCVQTARQQLPKNVDASFQLTTSSKLSALDSRASSLYAAKITTEPAISTTSIFVMTGATTAASIVGSDTATLGKIQAIPTEHQLVQRLPSGGRGYCAFDKHVKMFGSKGAEPGQFSRPYGLAVESDGNLIVGEIGNRRIQRITQQGQHVGFIQAPGRVYGVALEPSGSIWAAVGSSKLNLFNARTGVVRRTINCTDAYGLCRLDNGDLVVGCNEENKVVCFNADGTTRWSSTGQGFKKALGVTAIPDHQLVAVCDKDNNCIQLLSLQDGRFIRAIAGVTVPRGILFDAMTQALLVGERSSISAWALDGQLIHRWAINKVAYINCLAFTPDGTLFACDNNNSHICVYT